MMAILLKYGNTNTYLVRGTGGSLLIDTDYAGTLPGFYCAIKAAGVRVSDIDYVLATHYHPDHMGLIGELMQQGVKLLLLEHQRGQVHFSDAIFARDKHLRYTPIAEAQATVISCAESRAFLAGLGIAGELIATRSHSADGVALLLDGGECFVGDVEPPAFVAGYADNAALAQDWQLLRGGGAKVAHYAHRGDTEV